MPKCYFNKVAKQRYEITVLQGCSPVNLLYIIRGTLESCVCYNLKGIAQEKTCAKLHRKLINLLELKLL